VRAATVKQRAQPLVLLVRLVHLLKPVTTDVTSSSTRAVSDESVTCRVPTTDCAGGALHSLSNYFIHRLRRAAVPVHMQFPLSVSRSS
jgi:hypothetical protein